MATTFVLGNVLLVGIENPPELPFAGKQMVAVHDLPGGGRALQSMGPVDRSLKWTGILSGTNAMGRAKTIDAMRTAGALVPLRWGGITYQVIVEDFEPNYKHANWIPYAINCIPLSVFRFKALPATTTTRTTAFKAKAALANNPQSWWTSILTSAMTTFQNDLAPIVNLATAGLQAIENLKTDLTAIQQEVNSIKASVENGLQELSTVGGILPNNPVAAWVTNLTNQVNLATERFQIENLSALTIGMQTDLAIGETIPALVPLQVPTLSAGFSPQKTQTIRMVGSGSSLESLALKYYGDATQWPIIASANGLTNPVVPFTMNLIIPPYVPGLGPGGVAFLNASLNVKGTIQAGSGLTPETGASALPIDTTWTMCA